MAKNDTQAFPKELLDQLLAGRDPKTVLTPEGSMELSIPRDRHGRFDTALIAKYRRRFPGFDDKIIALYARGMSTRDIQGHSRERYGIKVSPDLVSAVTDQVIEEVAAWQTRPLAASYAIVFFDALRVKIRDEGLRNKAVFWRSAWTAGATSMYWGCGSSRLKGPSSGCA